MTPAHLEPVPGWVDNLNGPVGLMIGGAKGVIRSMLCNSEYNAEVRIILGKAVQISNNNFIFP